MALAITDTEGIAAILASVLALGGVDTVMPKALEVAMTDENDVAVPDSEGRSGTTAVVMGDVDAAADQLTLTLLLSEEDNDFDFVLLFDAAALALLEIELVVLLDTDTDEDVSPVLDADEEGI